MAANKILDYLSQRFPEWSNIAIQNIQDITSGWETEILSFDIEYNKSGTTEKHSWISRAYPGSHGPKRASSEYEIYQTLQSLKYPVPKVILLETDSKWLGKPFIIMERIIGPMMDDILQSGSEEARTEQIQNFGKLFVKLHTTDWSKASQIPDEQFKTNPKDMYLQRIDAYRKWVSNDGAEYLIPFVEWLQEKHHEITFDRYSLLHGDFHPLNILLDAAGNYFVIDWTAAKLGDYRSDLAWSMMLAFLYTEGDFWQIILREYESAAGHKVENIDYFLVEASIRRFADVLISLSDGAESLGMLEGTVEAMRSTLPLMTKLHGLVEEITGIRIKEIDERIAKFS